MSALILSSDSYALLTTLQLQRVASSRFLQELHGEHGDLNGLLESLHHGGLIRLRDLKQWCLTPQGQLSLILGVRAGRCPVPNWQQLPSLTGVDHANGVVRELCRGVEGEVPHYINNAELFALLELPDAYRLFADSSLAWQMLLLEHFSLQCLLDGPAKGQWPLADKLDDCDPQVKEWARQLEAEWYWLCSWDDDMTGPWPALQRLAQANQVTTSTPLATQLVAAFEPLQGGWPRSFSGFIWLGWLQQVDLPNASVHRKKWQRNLHGTSPLLEGLLTQWAGDRYKQPLGFVDALQQPVEMLSWGYIWLELCALARHGVQSMQVKTLYKWDLTSLLDAPPLHRLMAFCQDLLRQLLQEPAQHAPLCQLTVDVTPHVADETANSAGWLSWLQGLGRKTTSSQETERVAWILHADGPDFECKIQKLGSKGEWTQGRKVGMNLLITQYDHLLDEADRALVSCLSGDDGHFPQEVWPLFATHPRLFNSKGEKLQLSITAPLLHVVPVEAGVRISLYPMYRLSTVHILPIVDDLWQITITPAGLLEQFPALADGPLRIDGDLTSLQASLTAIPELIWHSQHSALHGNAQIEPWQGSAAVQLDWQKDQLEITLMTRDADQRSFPLASGEAIVRQGADRYRYWQRDLAGEQIQAVQLRAQLPSVQVGNYWRLEEQEALEFVEMLPNLVESGIPCYWHQESVRLKRLDESALSLRIEQAQDWFQIEGEIALDEQQILDLRLILRQIKPGIRTVQLDEKSTLILSDKLMERLTLIDTFVNEQQRIDRKLAYPLSRLLSVFATQGDEHWQALEQEWQQPVECPEALLQPLREYQKEGVRWLATLAHHGFGACLADDMGLGKTLQTLIVLRMRQHLGPALVVVPKSVVTNWQEEAARFAPDLEVVIFDQQSNREEIIANAKAGQLILINYGLIGSLFDPLKSRTWQTIVLDEAQQIKNAGTQRAKLLFQLDGQFRLALSGTPIENHLGELWSMFAFINPGLLGSLHDFKRRFGKAIKDPQQMTLLRAVISPFILRRLKLQVLTELPDKTEIIHHIALSTKERELYEATRREVVQQVQHSDGRTLMHVLSGLTRLRRLCCSPELIMPMWSHPTSKLDEALLLLEEAIAGGHRVLVFSQFVDLLGLLRTRVEKKQWDYCYLDGRCSAAARQEAILRFRHETIPLFLISLKAGGTGLNLTQADTVIHLDPWWNPAVEDQASDRAHRMGQTQPVTVYRLVCEQTVEEKIVALHDEKRALADSLLTGQSNVQQLDIERLRDLLIS